MGALKSAKPAWKVKQKNENPMIMIVFARVILGQKSIPWRFFFYGDEVHFKFYPETICVTFYVLVWMGFVWSDRVLVFVYRPVGMPKMEKVYLHNPSSEQISLISISATTAHFHASFFQNRVSTNYFDLLCFFVALYLLLKSKHRFHGSPSPVQVFFLKIEQSQLLTCTWKNLFVLKRCGSIKQCKCKLHFFFFFAFTTT